MKKKLFVVIAAMLAAALVLGGCGNKSSEVSSSSETARTIKAKELLSILDYNPTKQVKLPKGYMAMDISLENKYKVTDEAVAEQAEGIIAQYPYYVKSDKKNVKDDSVINIDYKGTIDGKAFDGGTAENQTLTIGSGTMIEGFESGLVGAKAGDTVKLNLKFPDDYSSEEVAGKDAVFEVKVNYICEPKDITFDTLTDDYVKQNFESSGITTVEEFKSQIETQVSDSLASEKENDLQEAVLDKLVNESEITIPDGLVDEQIESVMKDLKEQAEQSEMTVDEFLQEYGQMTEEEYKKELTEQVTEGVKQDLVLQAVIKKQKISIESADFYSYVDQIVSYYGYYYGYTSAQDYYDQLGGKGKAMLRYAESKALTEVMDGANVTYDKKPSEDTENEDALTGGEDAEESDEAVSDDKETIEIDADEEDIVETDE